MIFAFLALTNLVSACSQPDLFCYWEVWNTHKPDYASQLQGVPIRNTTHHGCNVVMIAFNDFTIGTDGLGRPIFGYINDQTMPNSTTFGHDNLLNSVNKIKSYGGKVYVSVGGATFSHGAITTNAQANAFADALALAIIHYGMQGVDFSQMNPASSEPILERIIKRIANNYPSIKIMYTIPAMGSYFDPWKTLLINTITKIDYVQTLFYDYYWLGYSLSTDLTNLQTLVPSSKIVIGIMPGCHDAAAEPLTTVPVATALAMQTCDDGNAGVAVWSVNRDTTTRTGLAGCLYVTGLASGTYTTALSTELSSC